jgi:Cof subfamily protein (haloacid dehalogenase superfamily)
MSILVNSETIKALALDLDGTLLAPGAILRDRTIRAVKLCLKRGIRIIIATGRAVEAAEPFRLSLGAEGPMIYFNGAVVADMPGNKILALTLLDKKAAEFCVDLSRDTGVYYQVYFPGRDKENRISLLAERESPERDMYHRHTGILAELGDMKEALGRPELQGCVKTMFLAEPEVLSEIRRKLDEHFAGSVYIAKTLATFLEVMDAKVSKGQALGFVMEHCSLKRKEVIAFGDEESDLPMFAAAGFAAAPSNAKDNVKAQADLVVNSNAEDGIAVFLEDFFRL